MKFEVKKECWHKGRRLMPGDVLEAESSDLRYMTAQGKLAPAAAEETQPAAEPDGETKRRGRKAVASAKNKTEGEIHE